MKTLVAALAALVSTSAYAFCGFYVAGGGAELFNNATQVVLMREGTRTGTTNYEGIPETTSYGSNRVARGAEHAEPGVAGGTYRPGESERERSVGGATTRP